MWETKEIGGAICEIQIWEKDLAEQIGQVVLDQDSKEEEREKMWKMWKIT